MSSRNEGTQARLEDVLKQDANPRSVVEHKNEIKEVQNYRDTSVVMYCLSALNLLKNNLELCKKVTLEIALLGQQGLDINNPNKKYRLKNPDGEFTGLHLVSYIYVGTSIIMPGQDAGIDFIGRVQGRPELVRDIIRDRLATTVECRSSQRIPARAGGSFV